MSSTALFIAGHPVGPALRLGKTEVGQQCQQDQIGAQSRQAIEAADGDVVADQPDDPGDQRPVRGGGKTSARWSAGRDQAGKPANYLLITIQTVTFGSCILSQQAGCLRIGNREIDARADRRRNLRRPLALRRAGIDDRTLQARQRNRELDSPRPSGAAGATARFLLWPCQIAPPPLLELGTVTDQTERINAFWTSQGGVQRARQPRAIPVPTWRPSTSVKLALAKEKKPAVKRGGIGQEALR